MSKCAECGANLFHTSFCGVPYRDKERDKFHSQIRELTAERDKYRDACERLIGHYGNEFNYDPIDFSYRPDVVGQKVFDFARQVKAEIEGGGAGPQERVEVS